MTDHNQFPIPARYVDKTAPAAARALVPALRALADSWTGLCGVLVLGPTGKGKSLAAGQAAARVARSQTDTWVKWVRADRLSRLLSDKGGNQMVDQLTSARLLVIDELGYERWPELLLEVLGDRHDNNRPTLVTSGLRLEQVCTRYSDATPRRIFEVGKGSIIDCWGSK